MKRKMPRPVPFHAQEWLCRICRQFARILIKFINEQLVGAEIARDREAVLPVQIIEWACADLPVGDWPVPVCCCRSTDSPRVPSDLTGNTATFPPT